MTGDELQSMQLHLSGCHALTLAYMAGVPTGALGSEGPFAAVPQARLPQGSREGQAGILVLISWLPRISAQEPGSCPWKCPALLHLRLWGGCRVTLQGAGLRSPPLSGPGP